MRIISLVVRVVVVVNFFARCSSRSIFVPFICTHVQILRTHLLLARCSRCLFRVFFSLFDLLRSFARSLDLCASSRSSFALLLSFILRGVLLLLVRSSFVYLHARSDFAQPYSSSRSFTLFVSRVLLVVRSSSFVRAFFRFMRIISLVVRVVVVYYFARYSSRSIFVPFICTHVQILRSNLLLARSRCLFRVFFSLSIFFVRSRV